MINYHRMNNTNIFDVANEYVNYYNNLLKIMIFFNRELCMGGSFLRRRSLQQPRGGDGHQRLLLHGCGPGHFHRHVERQQLHQIQQVSHWRYPVGDARRDWSAGSGTGAGAADRKPAVLAAAGCVRYL